MEEINYTDAQLTKDSKRATLKTDQWYLWKVKGIEAKDSKNGNPMLVVTLHPLARPTDANSEHFLKVKQWLTLASPLTKAEKDADKSGWTEGINVGQRVPRTFSFAGFIRSVFDDEHAFVDPKWEGPVLKHHANVLGEATSPDVRKALLEKELEIKKAVNKACFMRGMEMYKDQAVRSKALGRALYGKLVEDGDFPKITPMVPQLPPGVSLAKVEDFVA